LISDFVAQLDGETWTTGFVRSAGGGFGVVGTATWVGPAEGASTMLPELEPPQAASPSAVATTLRAASGRLVIERVRVANVF
jgi:hypothetical protein